MFTNMFWPVIWLSSGADSRIKLSLHVSPSLHNNIKNMYNLGENCSTTTNNNNVM
jgi:hypothetical protein